MSETYGRAPGPESLARRTLGSTSEEAEAAHVTPSGEGRQPGTPPSTLARLVRAARAVADAGPGRIEATARQLGESRRYLAPVAWAAGTLVLLVRGIKLLVLNWRLTLVELVPAVWVWLVMWDLKQHALRGVPFRQITLGGIQPALGRIKRRELSAFSHLSDSVLHPAHVALGLTGSGAGDYIDRPAHGLAALTRIVFLLAVRQVGVRRNVKVGVAERPCAAYFPSMKTHRALVDTLEQNV